MVVSPPPTSSFHSFSGFPLPVFPSIGGNFILYFSFFFVDMKHYSVAVSQDLNAILSVNHDLLGRWDSAPQSSPRVGRPVSGASVSRPRLTCGS